MQDRITASIVIYKNEIGLLKRAVESFLNSTEGSTLYLIDNSPTDECRQHFDDPRVTYRFNNRNIGFGAGHNIALKEILARGNSDYHIILNPDVYFDVNVTGTIFSFMEAHPTVGMVMPKVLFPDGRLQPLCKLLPSPLTLITRRFLNFFPSLLHRFNYSYEMHFSGYNRIMDVPFLSGCFMFVRTEALRRVGVFDESIFLYTEDTDLTRRIHRYYRTVFYPEATIYHYNARGSYRNLLIFTHHVFSAIKYFNKWGWFFDNERELINQRILLNFSE